MKKTIILFSLLFALSVLLPNKALALDKWNCGPYMCSGGCGDGGVSACGFDNHQCCCSNGCIEDACWDDSEADKNSCNNTPANTPIPTVTPTRTPTPTTPPAPTPSDPVVVYGKDKVLYSNGANQFILMDIDGTNVQTLFSGASLLDRDYMLSPRLDYLVTGSKLIKIPSGQQISLNTDIPTNSLVMLDISPDGTKIAMARYNQISTKTELHIYNSDGVLLKRVPDEYVISAHFSRDSKKLVAYTYYTNRLFLINSDGTGLQQLSTSTWPSTNNESARFSPDGTKLVFSANEGQNTRSIYSYNLSTNIHTLILKCNPVSSGKNYCINPTYSPDGSKILFASVDPLNETNQFLNVLTVGTNTVTQVATMQSVIFPDMGFSFNKSGSLIVYSDGHNIHTVKPDGTDNKIIHTGSVQLWNPLGHNFVGIETFYDFAPVGLARLDGSSTKLEGTVFDANVSSIIPIRNSTFEDGTVRWFRSNDIKAADFQAFSCTTYPPCGTEDKFLKVTYLNDNLDNNDPWVVSDWVDTGSWVAGSRYKIKFLAKSHSSNVLPSIGIQRYPKNGDWTLATPYTYGTVVFPTGAQFSPGPSFKEFTGTVQFDAPAGYGESKVRVVLRPGKKLDNSGWDTQPVYYDNVVLEQTFPVLTNDVADKRVRLDIYDVGADKTLTTGDTQLIQVYSTVSDDDSNGQFNFTLPASIKDGQNHYLQVWAINRNPDGNSYGTVNGQFIHKNITIGKYITFNSATITPIPSATPAATSTPTTAPPAPACPAGMPARSTGNANCDNKVDLLDFEQWRQEFKGTLTTNLADFQADTHVDLLDFEIWRHTFTIPAPTATPTLSPTPFAAAYYRTFVTSADYPNANFGSISAIDAKCQTLADATPNTAGSIFKAWVSTTTIDAKDHIKPNSFKPYKLVNGTQIASDWNDLIDGTLAAPINYTETNIKKDASGYRWAYTGTSKFGTMGKLGTTDANCANWTSTAATDYVVNGEIGDPTGFWSDIGAVPCDRVTGHGLYCFETDRQGPDTTPITLPEIGCDYQSSWGTLGSSNGQFSWPNQVAKDSDHNIFVVDMDNARIQKFTASGVYISQFGSNGNTDGQFDQPSSIALDSSDNIYVADMGNRRIQKFDSNGNFVKKWNTVIDASDTLDYIDSVAIDSSNNLYVSETKRSTNGGRIIVYNTNGDFQRTFGTPGTGVGQLSWLNGTAVDSSGNFYVVNVRHVVNVRDDVYVMKYANNGTLLAEWPTQASTIGGIGLDNTGNIFGGMPNDNQIRKFSPNGTILGTSGSPGNAPGQFNRAGGPMFDGTTAYIVDSGNNRIQKYTCN
ncbi:MAG: 6-bladed beta-propeller [Patescibacteria group bacterium]|jgi:Tol biopolymer transport system component